MQTNSIVSGVIIGLISQFAYCQEVKPFVSNLSQQDLIRINAEIDEFGLKNTPQVVDSKSASAISKSTKALVVRGGGRAALDNLSHLKNLESIYIIIDEIEEKDLEKLAVFKDLRRLSLGMSYSYRLNQEFWAPVSKLVSLEQFDVNCDP